MRLNTFTDYCLRTLMYVGLNDRTLTTRGNIAAAYGISDSHLMKVINWLSHQGYLTTVRGKGGGMQLARDPAAISIGELVRASESSSALVECFDPATSCCRIAPACRLKGIFGEAVEAMYQVLDKYTLADLLSKPRPLAALLQIA
ncbi:Rrf2 family transcriptional regulator [Dyella telluris]|uniref:Rrf2 family transcriptional regulator n=1 Tax=Dyella telluris TaxID=2763498 RepID=A0A7G8Q3H7_9GAMM|nr:Rrf2 family transcriptional regulator [Dyella telluris]QNK01335.1 Rrf2 family transcriptional regulator [Dyella telluris]